MIWGRRRAAAQISGRRATPSTASAFLALAFVITAIPRTSAGASPSARLTYVRSMDASSCPDEAALRKAVAARFGYDPFFPWAKKMVVVHLGHEDHHFTAHVELVDESGLTQGMRDLHADDDDCSQIFDATALAISIALDAFATSPAEPASPPTPAESELPRDAGSSATPPQPPLSIPAAGAAPKPATPESATPIVAGRSHTPAAVGLDVLGSFGGAPGPLGPTAGIGAFISAGGKASLELRLHADASAPVSVAPVGRVETAHFVATLAPCAHFRIVSACGLGEVGWVQGWGMDLETVRSQAAPFVAAGARVGIAVPISETVAVRIYAEGIIDLDRARFQLDYYDAWTAPLAEGTLAIGFARRIQ
jgi:hypothetical protein